MEELVFKTNRALDEIHKDFENVDAFEEVMASLQEALAYEQGKDCPGIVVRTVSLPETNDNDE